MKTFATCCATSGAPSICSGTVAPSTGAATSSASARAIPGSPSVRAQLRAAEDRLEALHARHAELKSLARLPAVDRAWIERRLEDLAGLLRADPIRARAEIAKHLAGQNWFLCDVGRAACLYGLKRRCKG